MATSQPKVLIWGIAGASLGVEIAKSLAHDGGFDVRGADTNDAAYGHFSGLFTETYTLNKDTSSGDIIEILKRESIDCLIAGGEVIIKICDKILPDIEKAGSAYASNNSKTISNCFDKYKCFSLLSEQRIPTPKTYLLSDIRAIENSIMPPYIIKPRTDSGRSKGVKVISSFNELQAVRGELISAADQWICQEYLADSSSEITVGVLSDCRGAAVGAILLHRTFDNILSVYDRSDSYLISSAFSQGYFKRDKAYELAAMAIAEAVDSTGPLNIQCRVKDGILYPFEINPRLSGSTYLRTLAGVNEPSLYIKHLLTGADIEYPTPREGLCLRSFTECFVEKKST